MRLIDVKGNLIYENEDIIHIKSLVSEAHSKGISLSGAYLRGVDLTHLNLRGVDFSGAHFLDADLSYSYFHGANFKGATLTDANCTLTSFEGADLTDANLTGTVLTYAKTDKRYVQVAGIGRSKRMTTYCFEDDKVWCGCFTGTLKEFEKQVKYVHNDNPVHLKEYLGFIEYVKSLK